MEKTERGHQKMNEKVVNAALLGLGTVGTGVYKVIKSQEQEMTAKLGCQVKITKILVRNLEKASGKVDDPSVLTTEKRSWKLPGQRRRIFCLRQQLPEESRSSAR